MSLVDFNNSDFLKQLEEFRQVQESFKENMDEFYLVILGIIIFRKYYLTFRFL